MFKRTRIYEEHFMFLLTWQWCLRWECVSQILWQSLSHVVGDEFSDVNYYHLPMNQKGGAEEHVYWILCKICNSDVDCSRIDGNYTIIFHNSL